MADLMTDLGAFMARYEEANNSHDIDRVVPFIAEDATYWFSDGSHHGIDEIRAAVMRTFATIQDETYEITDLHWVSVTADVAVCRYRFSWQGVVGGEPRAGQGRGTNVIVKRHGDWKMQHEHLSP